MWPNWKVSALSPIRLGAVLIKLDIPNPGNSGKNSLFITLLRLLDIQTGSLEVDDMDVSYTTVYCPTTLLHRRSPGSIPSSPR